MEKMFLLRARKKIPVLRMFSCVRHARFGAAHWRKFFVVFQDQREVFKGALGQTDGWWGVWLYPLMLIQARIRILCSRRKDGGRKCNLEPEILAALISSPLESINFWGSGIKRWSGVEGASVSLSALECQLLEVWKSELTPNPSKCSDS